MNDQTQQDTAQSKKGRGVSYPFIGLEQALEKARAFHRAERKSAAPVSAATKHFGYAGTSSGGRQTVATLLQFGLMEDEGRREDRHVKLTDRALTAILAEPESEERTAALQECVQMPRVYSQILAKWPADNLPSDHTIGYYLQREFDFNPKTLKDFIDDFRASLAFARMGQNATMSASPSLGETQSKGWETIEMSTSQQLSDKALQHVTRAGQPPKMSDTLVVGGSPVFDFSTAERQWMHGTLSRGTSYRLLGVGEMTAKDLGKLITLLGAQKAVLEDDDLDDLGLPRS